MRCSSAAGSPRGCSGPRRDTIRCKGESAMKAAVMRAFKQPLELEDIDISRPGPREVLMRTAATGVCHSDLHVIEAGLPVPPPLVLGHEPAGIVEAVGEVVTHVQPGDHAIGCLFAVCGSFGDLFTGRAHTFRGP